MPDLPDSATRRHLLLTVGILLTACGQTPDQGHEFAVFGDNPYSPETVPKVQALIGDVNGRSNLEWVIHVGDTKGGRECQDGIYRSRFDLYQGFLIPFVFTPGDNDWFDCAPERDGGFDKYERLNHLRSLYFPEPGQTTGGRSMAVRTQSSEPGYEDFVENVMWVHGDVV